MTRFIPALLITALALFTASCGCKQELRVPELRKQPKFDDPTYTPQPSMHHLLDELEEKLTEEPIVTPTK